MVRRAWAKGKHMLVRYRVKRLGLRCVPPNYGFFDRFTPGEVAIDVGVGDDPDFSLYLVKNYGMECFAVDPTHKHASKLQQIEHEVPLFHYLPCALGPDDGTVEFCESTINVSGSLLEGHRNIVEDPCIRYDVQMVSLESLVAQIGREPIGILKMDTEGAEYGIISKMSQATLSKIRQLMVEFHHGTVEGITWHDTALAIRTIEKLGMKSFVYNGRDCLFYW